ncbi:MAG: ribosomal protein S18 acetylase RimI-like enzyme [Paracoccaceae bacterium]|jgi:ribosomal protein S18 acetylase RimI-like enzyme
MTPRISKGLPDHLRHQATQLYWQVFCSKLGRLLGPKAKALKFLSQDLNGDYCLIAQDAAGQLIGIVGFQTYAGSYTQGQAPALRQVYGFLGAFWRRGVFHLLRNRHPAAASFIVDTIAVIPEVRGRGVGGALLEKLCILARAKGHYQIALDVAINNHAAQRLYLRHGFERVAEQSLGLLGWLLGVQNSVVMRRDLSSQTSQEPDRSE